MPVPSPTLTGLLGGWGSARIPRAEPLESLARGGLMPVPCPRACLSSVRAGAVARDVSRATRHREVATHACPIAVREPRPVVFHRRLAVARFAADACPLSGLSQDCDSCLSHRRARDSCLSHRRARTAARDISRAARPWTFAADACPLSGPRSTASAARGASPCSPGRRLSIRKPVRAAQVGRSTGGSAAGCALGAGVSASTGFGAGAGASAG